MGTVAPRARRAAIVAALGIALAAPASGQDTGEITLRMSPQKGDQWSFDESSTFQSNIKVMANGQLAQELAQKAEKLERGETHIVAVEGDKIMEIEVRFSPETGDKTEQQGQPPRTERPSYAGKTIKIKRQATGEPAYETDAQLSPEDQKKLKKLLDPQAGFFPKKPVKVGERWVADEKALAEEFELGPEDRGTVRCRLKGVRQVDGLDAADVEVAMVVNKKQDFFLMTFDMEGLMVIDRRSGVVLDGELSGPITISGEREVPGENGQIVKISIEGGGQASFKSRSRPLKRGGPQKEGGAPLTEESDWGGTEAPAQAATPQACYDAMLAALERGDFAKFKALHTEKAQAELTQEGFERGRKRLAEKGPPPFGSFAPQGAERVDVMLSNGRFLTTLVKEGGAWRADTVWTK
jgi:hypothetical protein